MTETIEPMAAHIDQQRLAEDLVAQAREEGVQLVGGGGLLSVRVLFVARAGFRIRLSAHTRSQRTASSTGSALISRRQPMCPSVARTNRDTSN